MIAAILKTMVVFVIVGITLFISAGRLNFPMFWANLAVLVIFGIVILALLYKYSPDLVEERIHPGPGERDKFSIIILTFCFYIHWIIAGLDVGRFHWSGYIPMYVQIVGLIGYAIGFWIFGWSTLVNRFFSSAVRLQEDRGQYVITSGPYKYVRHPGYSSSILFLLCSGIALGSWWSILPMFVVVLTLIWRTNLEDKMLQDGLEGYIEYSQVVKYRLIPGVW